MRLKGLSELRSLLSVAKVPDNVRAVQIGKPSKYLEFLAKSDGKRVPIEEFTILQPWGIVALAALGRRKQAPFIIVERNADTPVTRFAHAMGLDEIIQGREPDRAKERERTVRLHTVRSFADIEPISSWISKLVIPEVGNIESVDYLDADEVRKTIYYVMVELLRNAIQHSQDLDGAIIMAQTMDKGANYDNPCIQIAVADCGIGIQASLQQTRPEVIEPEMALQRAIWPYYSGMFHEYERGSSQNAGLGLFFTTEMAKRSAGKFLLASRGATLLIEGDPEGRDNTNIELYTSDFPGTLVSFEMPKKGIADYDSLISVINKTARERTRKREENHWIQYDIQPENSIEFIVNIALENTVEAESFGQRQLIPRIEKGEIIVLNFTNMSICTQSFMHALLFKPITTAFEMKVPLYVKGASATIADSIRLIEMYAL